MIIVSPKLVNVIINHWNNSGQLLQQREVEEIEGNAEGVAIVSSKVMLTGYSLSEVLMYLLEKAERTDDEIYDMKTEIK